MASRARVIASCGEVVGELIDLEAAGGLTVISIVIGTDICNPRQRLQVTGLGISDLISVLTQLHERAAKP